MSRSLSLFTIATALLMTLLMLSACGPVNLDAIDPNVNVDVSAIPVTPLPLEDLDALNIDTETVTAVAWSSDESLIAVGYENGAVHIFDAESGDLINEFQDTSVTITHLTWSSDGAQIISTDANDVTTVIQLSD